MANGLSFLFILVMFNAPPQRLQLSNLTLLSTLPCISDAVSSSLVSCHPFAIPETDPLHHRLDMFYLTVWNVGMGF